MDKNQITLLIVGFIVVISGLLGIGKNRKKNRLIVSMLGETGFKIFTVIIGIILIVLSFFISKVK